MMGVVSHLAQRGPKHLWSWPEILRGVTPSLIKPQNCFGVVLMLAMMINLILMMIMIMMTMMMMIMMMILMMIMIMMLCTLYTSREQSFWLQERVIPNCSSAEAAWPTFICSIWTNTFVNFKNTLFYLDKYSLHLCH